MIINTPLASIQEVIQKLHPGTEPNIDFTIDNGVNGPQITDWQIHAIMPTDDVINLELAKIAQKNKELEIRDIGNATLIYAVTPYMDAEQKTWPIQVEEATKYRQGFTSPSDIPFLTNLAAGRQVTVPDLVAMVEGNNGLFRMYAGQILGGQQYLLGLIYSVDLTNPAVALATLEQIVWEVPSA